MCLRAFHKKVLSLSLSLFFSLWLAHSLGCYLMLATSDCPQGIQAILSMQPMPPYSVPAAGGGMRPGYLSAGSHGYAHNL